MTENFGTSHPDKPRVPEPLKVNKPLIVSLLGPSGSGKSTLISSAIDILQQRGVPSVVIKKDDMIRRITEERFGDKSKKIGYTPARGFGEQTVNAAINEEIKKHAYSSGVIFLEGGTRTRTAMNVTLADVEADRVIVKLRIKPGELARRLRNRRQTQDRVDDGLAIIGLKLAGQYIRPLLGKGVKDSDSDVVTIDANGSSEEVLEYLMAIIDSSLEDRQGSV